MDILGEFSIETTRWLQENYPQLEKLFFYITEAGRFEFYLVIITLTYWCIHKRLGRALGYLLSVSYVLNAMVKHLTRNGRPFWDDLSLALVDEHSYGVPSGHAQAATVFYGLLIYLGVHDIEDVLAGILLGSLVLLGYVIWGRYFAARFNNRILGQRLLIAISFPLILALIYALPLILLDEPQRPPQYDTLVNAAERQSWEDSATAFGLLLGLSIGFVMEISRVRFMVDGSLGKRALRYLVGIVVALVLWRGLGVLLPDDPLALAVPLRAIRYIIVALWVSYYAPWVFVRFKLADTRPEPEVSLTV
jgi:hypothetical protein